MAPDTHKSGMDCAKFDIAAYLDGELTPDQEFDIESHISGCGLCQTEYQLQKEILFAIDSVVDDVNELLEVPAEFAKVVTVKAESNVSGIRTSSERFRAVFALAFLLFLAAISLGTEAGAIAFAASQNVLLKLISVTGFFFHLIFEIGTGFGVVLRGLGQSLIFSSLATLVAAVFVFAVSSLTLSRLIQRLNRSSKV